MADFIAYFATNTDAIYETNQLAGLTLNFFVDSTFE